MSNWKRYIDSIPSSFRELFIEFKNDPKFEHTLGRNFIEQFVKSKVFHSGQGKTTNPNGDIKAMESAIKNFVKDGGGFNESNSIVLSIRSGKNLSSSKTWEIIEYLRKQHKLDANLAWVTVTDKKLNNNVVITILGTRKMFCKIASLNIETTGLSKHDKIIDIGIVKYDREGDMILKTSQLVNPGFSFSLASTRSTGITNKMVKNKPGIKYIKNKFKKVLSDADYILIHNGGYGIPFLQRELGKNILRKNKVVDLLKISRFFDNKKGSSHTLTAICKRYKVKIKNHRVVPSAISTYECLKQMIYTHGFSLDDFVYRYK